VAAVVIAVCMVLAPAAARAEVSPAPDNDSLQITFVDVGQGDATVYRGPCGEVGVIDVALGGAPAVASVLRSYGLGELEWIAVSHYHDDHYGGVPVLAEEFHTAVLYDHGGAPLSKPGSHFVDYEKWRTSVPTKVSPQAGATFSLCEGQGDDEVVFKVISIGSGGVAHGVHIEDENDTSMCLLISFRSFRGFTCGDLSGEKHRDYRDVETGVAKDVGGVDVLKVSHHGSRFSSNEDFGNALCPKVSVISVGATNTFGHPNAGVVSRLDKCDDVYLTDPPAGFQRSGNVTVTTNGHAEMVVTTETSSESRRYPLKLAPAEERSPAKMDLVPTFVVLLICIAYAIAAWLLQLHRGAAPRDWLRERIRDLHARIGLEGWNAGSEAQANLESLEKAISKPWFVVPASRVQSGWRHVHSLEEARLTELPSEDVDERLRESRSRLESAPGNAAAEIVERIDEVLGSPPPRAREPVPASLDERRAALRRAQTHRHNRNDTHYEDLGSLMAKAVWLTTVALALIVGLAAAFDREVYFLLGAVGALVSRLTRVLRQKPSASDYGASWSTLILSPAAGALAGWIGVFLVSVLAGNPFNVLGDSFSEIWDKAPSSLGLMLAFAFGFSERLFERLLGTAVDAVGDEMPKEKKRKKQRGRQRTKGEHGSAGGAGQDHAAEEQNGALGQPRKSDPDSA